MKWVEDGEHLVLDIMFNNFKEAMNFIIKVGELAEQENHHPDIFLYSYKNVKILLTTHSENRLTQKDYELAKKIDLLLEKK